VLDLPLAAFRFPRCSSASSCSWRSWGSGCTTRGTDERYLEAHEVASHPRRGSWALSYGRPSQPVPGACSNTLFITWLSRSTSQLLFFLQKPQVMVVILMGGHCTNLAVERQLVAQPKPLSRVHSSQLPSIPTPCVLCLPLSVQSVRVHTKGIRTLRYGSRPADRRPAVRLLSSAFQLGRCRRCSVPGFQTVAFREQAILLRMTSLRERRSGNGPFRTNGPLLRIFSLMKIACPCHWYSLGSYESLKAEPGCEGAASHWRQFGKRSGSLGGGCQELRPPWRPSLDSLISFLQSLSSQVFGRLARRQFWKTLRQNQVRSPQRA